LEPTETAPKLDLHRNSHLAASESELPFTEFELALHHIAEAFSHWSVELNTFVGGGTLPVQDVSVLQVIRMRDCPKSAVEIGKYLNREDAANILYSLRKLERSGLIEKVGDAPRQIAYRVTALGHEVTERYASLRRDVLLNLIGSLSEPLQMLEDVTKRMWLLAGMYEQAARTIAIMGFLPSNVRPVYAAATPSSGADRAGASNAKAPIPAAGNAVRTRRNRRA